MSGFPILDLILGMIFVYFMLSIISSSAVEIILSYYKLRARVLEQWLFKIFDKKMLQPDGSRSILGQSIMDHCITTAMSKAGKSTSFIDAHNFTSALLEKVTYNINTPDTVATNLNDIINALHNATALDGSSLLSTELKRTFLAFAYEARADFQVMEKKTDSEMQLFRNKVETWYDSSMDRVEGHLKKKYSRPFTFWISLIAVLALNADSVAIARYLYNNPDVRSKVVAQATAAARDSTLREKVRNLSGADSVDKKDLITDIKEQQLDLKQQIAKLEENVPLGWRQADLDKLQKYPKTILPKLAGWFATIFAVMLGAPFWFDLLNKVANLRGTGAKPASNTDQQRKTADSDQQ